MVAPVVPDAPVKITVEPCEGWDPQHDPTASVEECEDVLEGLVVVTDVLQDVDEHDRVERACVAGASKVTAANRDLRPSGKAVLENRRTPLREISRQNAVAGCQERRECAVPGANLEDPVSERRLDQVEDPLPVPIGVVEVVEGFGQFAISLGERWGAARRSRRPFHRRDASRRHANWTACPATLARMVSVGEQPASRQQVRARHAREPGPTAVSTIVMSSAIVWLFGAMVFFRAQWRSGFNTLPGNDGDTRLIIYLEEHWYLAFRGRAAWLDPAFFYPTKGLLGYSESTLLYQIFFVPLRVLGVDEFHSFEFTLILMSLMGFVAFVAFAHRTWHPPLPVTLVAAFTFTFANNLWTHAGSPQMFGIYFVPIVLLLGHQAWRDRDRRRLRSVACASSAGLLAALALFTSYYATWLSMLAAGVFVVACAVFLPATLAAVAARLLRARLTVVGAAVGFGVGILPFLATYLPVLHSLGGRKYGDAMYYATTWTDLTNVSLGNVAWGRLLGHTWLQARQSGYEVDYAVTPVLLAAAVVGSLMVGWRNRHAPQAADTVPDEIPVSRQRLGVAIALTLVVLALLPIQSHGGSAWVVVWHIPGGQAIRAIDRLQVATGLGASLALAWAGAGLFRRWPDRPAARSLRLAVTAVLAVAAFEQVDTAPVSFVNAGAQVRLLHSVTPPPPTCRAFYVTAAVQPLPFYEYQIDAMLISQQIGLPTINGYSGDTPPGWGLLLTGDPGYRAQVAQWSTTHGLTASLCALELTTMTWTAPPAP